MRRHKEHFSLIAFQTMRFETYLKGTRISANSDGNVILLQGM
jgi:hypothetical protein